MAGRRWMLVDMFRRTTPRPANWSGGFTPYLVIRPSRLKVRFSRRQRKLGPENGGNSVVAEQYGIALFTTPNSTSCSSVLVTALRGTAGLGVPEAETTFFFHQSWLSTQRRASMFGIIRRRLE